MPFRKSEIDDVLCRRCKNAVFELSIGMLESYCVNDGCKRIGDNIKVVIDGRYCWWTIHKKGSTQLRRLQSSAFSPTKEYEGLY